MPTPAGPPTHDTPVLVVRAGHGERVPVGEQDVLLRLTSGSTSGRLSLAEITLPPSSALGGAHVHRAHDETFYVLAGELLVTTGDGEVSLGVGDLAHAPRGSVHGFRTGEAAGCTLLAVYDPACFEGYFRDVRAAMGGGREVTDETLARLRARHATESV